MDNQLRPFLVELTLPEFTDEFVALIPEQRAIVERYMSAGSITSVSLAADRSRCWFTMVAATIGEIENILAEFPISAFSDAQIIPLMFQEHPYLNVTHFSLN